MVTFPLALLVLRPRVAGFRARLSAALAAAFVGGVAWRVWCAATAPHLHLPLLQLNQPAKLASYLMVLKVGPAAVWWCKSPCSCWLVGLSTRGQLWDFTKLCKTWGHTRLGGLPED